MGWSPQSARADAAPTRWPPQPARAEATPARWSPLSAKLFGTPGTDAPTLQLGRQPARRPEVQNAIEVVCRIISEMIEVKYGYLLDEADLLRKVRRLCSDTTLARGESGSPKGPWPADIVELLNDKPELQFRVKQGQSLVGLHVEAHPSTCFEELRRQVVKMPGTARAAVVISGGASHAAPPDGAALISVAVFREHYRDAGLLMGRSDVLASAQLCAVAADQLRAALLLDPRITRELRCFSLTGAAQDLPQPQLRPEYLHLGAWLLPSEAGAPVLPEDAGASRTGHVAAKPWACALAEAVQFAPAPKAAWMATLWRALEHPDAGGAELLALLRLARAWLDGSEGAEVRLSAQAALDVEGFPHGGLVECVRRVGSGRGTEGGACDATLCIKAASMLRLVLQDSPHRLPPLMRAGVVPAVCGLMQAWPESLQVQVAAAAVLSELLSDRAAAMEALNLNVAILINIATSSYPGSQELQVYSTLAVQRMVMHR